MYFLNKYKKHLSICGIEFFEKDGFVYFYPDTLVWILKLRRDFVDFEKCKKYGIKEIEYKEEERDIIGISQVIDELTKEYPVSFNIKVKDFLRFLEERMKTFRKKFGNIYRVFDDGFSKFEFVDGKFFIDGLVYGNIDIIKNSDMGVMEYYNLPKLLVILKNVSIFEKCEVTFDDYYPLVVRNDNFVCYMSPAERDCIG